VRSPVTFAVSVCGVETSVLLAALLDHKFTARADNPLEFAERTRVLPLVHDPTGLPCDLVLAGPGLEPIFLDRLVVIRVDDLDVPVASAEDIVVMKVLAGRPKDLDDAASVIAAGGDGLDLEQARSTLREIERALDRDDLIAVLDQIEERVGKA
jgi:hypothetical protein